MDPHNYYKQYISPYKGALEEWYLSNRSTFVDLKLIFLTAWVIISPHSKLPYRIFPSLPERPVHLQ